MKLANVISVLQPPPTGGESWYAYDVVIESKDGYVQVRCAGIREAADLAEAVNANVETIRRAYLKEQTS